MQTLYYLSTYYFISPTLFFFFILQIDLLSNVIYKSPQKHGSKNGVFLLFLCSKIVLKPLYVVVIWFYFSSEPQYVIRIIVRKYVVKQKGKDYFEKDFVNKFDGTTRIGLLLTLTIIFSFQGNQILNNPFHILLIAIPLIIQNVAVFFLGYGGAKACKLPFKLMGL